MTEHTDEFRAINSTLERIERITLLGAKNVLTIDEVALLIGLSKDRLYKLTSSHEIPYYKPDGRSKPYFKKAEIEDWLLQNRIATVEEINNQAVTRIAIGR